MFNKFKYFSIILAVTFVFVSGFIVGTWLTSIDKESFLSAADEIRVNSLSADVQRDIAANNICNVDVFQIGDDRTALGKRLQGLENSLGKDNPEVLKLKREYSILSIRQWLLVKESKESCNKDFNTILFFYSNKPENLQESELQGYVLDYLYRKYPNKVSIFSLDIDLKEPTVETLMDVYNASKSPTVIINDNKFEGLKNREDLEPLII